MYGRKPPTKKYMKSLAMLYGQTEASAVSVAEVAPKVRKKRTYDEDVEQIKFNLWFEKYLWENDCRWWHTPNGGRRSAIEGGKFKRMGVKPGVPDIVIPMARKGFYGLVIELKKVDGVASDVSKEQKEWLAWFRRQNWLTNVAFGFEKAKAMVLDYFELEQ